VALRLAASMLALQASIGALNDLVDVGVDSGRKPGKPLPRGAARPFEAAAIVAVGLGLGIGLSAASGPATAVVAAAGVACGYAYDLRLSRTVWSWLPLTVALPLVPVHAWLGTTGSVPASLLGIVPAGLLAGAALALGNGIVDEERDRMAGMRTVVVALGRGPAWILQGLGLAGAVGIALVAGPSLGGGEAGAVLWRGLAVTVAAGLMAIGAGLAARPAPRLRERGWELEAVGVAVLGIAWLAGVSRS
jgi:4-hydroxybenzoate polyprenyltransferase